MSIFVTRRTATGQPDLPFPLGGRGDGWGEVTEAANTWRDVQADFAVQQDDGVLVVASHRSAVGGPRRSFVFRIRP